MFYQAFTYMKHVIVVVFQASEGVNSEPNLTEGICQFCDIHCLEFLQKLKH